MAFDRSNGPESLGHSPENKGGLKRPDLADSGEIKEAANMGRSAVESLGLDESGAEAMGNVSEGAGKISENRGGGGIAGTGKAVNPIDPAAIRAALLKNIPAEKAMRRQIEREIKAEINYLHRKTMKMLRSPGQINYFEMSNMVMKIRELRKILSTLLKASVDALKTMWLRYVHGVM